MKCSKCKFDNPESAKFCIECGQHFGEEVARITELAIEGERKQVTVLFSDLTGYTAMSEKLDPEEVKEITRRIFSEISKIVAKYDGFIEKYAGDAVMALFGVPEAHEDDPIRAIKVAREIHELVNEISPEVENRIGQSISMHTGINTGLVVTGEVNLARGTHGIAGEPINLASRLSNLAKPGEILVGSETYIQTESYFNFESLGPAKLKGKSESSAGPGKKDKRLSENSALLDAAIMRPSRRAGYETTQTASHSNLQGQGGVSGLARR